MTQIIFCSLVVLTSWGSVNQFKVNSWSPLHLQTSTPSSKRDTPPRTQLSASDNSNVVGLLPSRRSRGRVWQSRDGTPSRYLQRWAKPPWLVFTLQPPCSFKHIQVDKHLLEECSQGVKHPFPLLWPESKTFQFVKDFHHILPSLSVQTASGFQRRARTNAGDVVAHPTTKEARSSSPHFRALSQTTHAHASLNPCIPHPHHPPYNPVYVCSVTQSTVNAPFLPTVPPAAGSSAFPTSST